MAQQHLIQKYIFDVDFDNEEKAYHFQSQLAAFIKEKMVSATDEVLTEFSSSSDRIGIKKITIDLGHLSLNNFDSEVIRLLKEKLRDKLKLLMIDGGSHSLEEEVVYISKKRTDIELIEYFLQHGRLPWSAPKEEGFSIQSILTQYIDQEPTEIKSIISSAVTSGERSLRVIRQLGEEVRWKLIRLWISTETAKLHKFYEEAVIAYRNKQIVKQTLGEYKELLWQFIFSEVVLLNKSHINFEGLSIDLIKFLSKVTHLTEDNLIKDFFEAVTQRQSGSQVISDPHILSDYKNEFAANIIILHKQQIEQVGKTERFEGTVKKDKDQPASQQLSTQSSSHVNDVDEFTAKKIEAEKLQEFRRQQLERRREYVLAFFEVVQSVRDLEEVRSQIEKIEFVIKELLNSGPLVLKNLIERTAINVKEITGQRILELFSKEIRGLLLKEVWAVSEEQFEQFKFETSKNIVIQFIETGIIPFSALPSFVKTPEFKSIIKLTFEFGQAEKIISLLGEIKDSGKVHITYEQMNGVLDSATIEKYFSEDFFVSDSVKKSGGKGKSKTEKKTKLVNLKTENQILSVLEFWLEERKLPETAEYSIDQLIKKFFKLSRTAVVDFLVSLDKNDFEVLQKEIVKVVSASEWKEIEEKRLIIQNQIANIRESNKSGDLLKKAPEVVAENSLKKSFDKATEELKPFKKLESGEPIYINNSGLVIFHPYLSRFFKMFDLLDKKSFKDEFSAHKAAHLLQYLVNKNTNAEEHEMTLNKIVCGINLSTPLIREIEISDEEKNICESLIEGVIQNWPILKKTSNDGFRGSFLIREGRLQAEANNWRLRVEERGYDILIEKLPWSISIVKLAWMNQTVYVDWK